MAGSKDKKGGIQVVSKHMNLHITKECCER